MLSHREHVQVLSIFGHLPGPFDSESVFLLLQLAQGGTAVGTGLNTRKGYAVSSRFSLQQIKSCAFLGSIDFCDGGNVMLICSISKV